jgi:hypothetical protein
MAFDLAGVSGVAFSWLTSFMFWGIALFLVLLVTVGSLIIRKKRKLIYPAIELTDLGAGKIGFKTHRAGWFKTKTMFFGMFDYGGEDILRLKDGRQVQDASSEDFHDIDGKRGLLVIRKSDDPAILVPVNKAGTTNNYKKEEIFKKDKNGNLVGTGKYRLVPIPVTAVKKMEVTNAHLLAEIAPADYRDASVKIVNNTEKETQGKWEKLAPILVFGTMAIVFMITIILIVQMVKQGQTEAKNLLLEAGKVVLEASKNTIQASASAP